MNSDDLVLNNICPVILNYDDRYLKFRSGMNRFHPVIENVNKDNVIDALNYFTYNACMAVVITPNISLKAIERSFHLQSNLWLSYNLIDISIVAKAWVRFLDLYNKLQAIFLKYEESYSQLKFLKTIRGNSFNLTADCLLKNKDKIDLLMIVPKSVGNKSMEVISNAETLFALDYLFESNIKIDKIIELSYSSNLSDSLIKEKVISVNEKIKSHVRSFISQLDVSLHNSRASITYCNFCCYKDICGSKVRL